MSVNEPSPFWPKIGGGLLLLVSVPTGIYNAFVWVIQLWIGSHAEAPSNVHQVLVTSLFFALACVAGLIGLRLLTWRVGVSGDGANKIIVGFIGGLAFVTIVLCAMATPVVAFCCSMENAALAGRSYMDSLTPRDIQAWIDRSKALLDAPPPNESLYRDDIPEDLRKMHIIRIDVEKNAVDYVWVGGMDHTFLIVERQEDGTYVVTARYDDEHERVLWPMP